MKHLFIINPKAGKENARQSLEKKIRRCFSGLEYEIAVTRYAGQAREMTRAAGESGQEVRVYACGGDGTLNEVVCGGAGYDNLAVTHVPVGTGNDFLRIFGKGAKRFHDLEALRTGPQTPMDVIDCNGKLGLDIACAGVDARVANDVHKYKNLPIPIGAGAYVIALFENIFRKEIARPMKVTVAGQTFDQDFTILCVCNGRHYGGGFMPVGDAMPDDGVLDILLVRKVSLFTFLRLLKTYATGRYRERPDLIWEFHTDRIDFSSAERIITVVDGEVMEDTSFTVSLSEKKINFFYPQGVTYAVERKISTPAG